MTKRTTDTQKLSPGPHGANCQCGPLNISQTILVFRHWKEFDPRDQERAVCYACARISILIAPIVFILHAWLAHELNCAATFQRGGAFVTALVAFGFGLIELARDQTARIGRNPPIDVSGRNPFIVLPLVAFFATIVWGYGDLVFPASFDCN